MFDIHTYPNKQQYNLIYTDMKAKKGNTEVISMLDTYARMRNIDTMWKGSKHWHICADNCGVQAKNNYVLQLLVF
ncbi:hypothetical protein PF007_g8063 [Phytophthora fragariae]|uniref:Uncharacterized protein n=1 Tax=Phytophthora fragariae TaxID=53985 RepID=A0A6A3LFT7_9STRA|nr:hypothetical protein PF011_g6495 [Phytophthora fragariae]KAE9120716.1 hypothetical protein PF007_g8063 [Phytophthora fragariae]KAE9144036.1 hypothetical protein PF006_g10984 [Phytophthora fragariae]